MNLPDRKLGLPVDAVLCTDDNGREYVAYNSIVGPIRDYSPWTIKQFKETMKNGK